jgi:hypothetical protein
MININVGPAVAVVEGPVESLETELTRRRLIFDDDEGPPGAKGSALLEEFFWRDDRGRLVTFSGLTLRCCKYLRSIGIDPVVKDTRQFLPAHQSDPYVLTSATGHVRRLLEILTRRTCGQIEIGGNDSVEHIGQICQLFRWATVVIVTASRNRAVLLRRDLSGFLQKPVDLVRSGSHYPRNRVIVCMPAQMGLFRSRDSHVLIVADAAELDGKRMAQELTSAMHLFLRRYALVRTGQFFSNDQQLAVEAITGPLIYDRCDKPAEVRVQICRALAIPKRKLTDALAEKRQNIWHQPQRNNLIARLATSLANRDVQALWEMGSFLDDADGRWLTAGVELKTHILVESLEHGRALNTLLPDWSIWACAPSTAHGTSGSPERAIVTTAYAHKNGLDADIVICGDDNMAPIQFPGFPGPAQTCHAGRKYLIELDDDLQPASRNICRRPTC